MSQTLVLQFDYSRYDEAYEQIHAATYVASCWVDMPNGLDFVCGISAGPMRVNEDILQYSINRFASVSMVYSFLKLCPDVRLVVVDM